MTIRFLAESFADQRRNPTGTLGDLLAQFGMATEARIIEDGRNCNGRFKGLLVNLQIF